MHYTSQKKRGTWPDRKSFQEEKNFPLCKQGAEHWQQVAIKHHGGSLRYSCKCSSAFQNREPRLATRLSQYIGKKYCHEVLRLTSKTTWKLPHSLHLPWIHITRKCPQTGNAQKGKLPINQPRLSEQHECYHVQGPIPARDQDLKVKDGLRQGNTSLGWCSLQIKASKQSSWVSGCFFVHEKHLYLYKASYNLLNLSLNFSQVQQFNGTQCGESFHLLPICCLTITWAVSLFTILCKTLCNISLFIFLMQVGMSLNSTKTSWGQGRWDQADELQTKKWEGSYVRRVHPCMYCRAKGKSNM